MKHSFTFFLGLFILLGSACSSSNQSGLTDIRAEPVAGGIEVTWQYAGDSPGFTIYRKDEANHDYLPISDVPGDVRSFTDTPPSQDVAYTYAVALAGASTLNEQQGPPVRPGDPKPPNEAPVIEDFSVTPDAADVDATVQFSWDISDEDGDSLSCTLEPGDGSEAYTLEPCSSGTTQSHTYTAAGSYTVSLRVTDGTEEVVDTLTLTVRSSDTYGVTDISGTVEDRPDGPAFLQLTGFYSVQSDGGISLEDYSISTGLAGDGSFSFDPLPDPGRDGLTILASALISSEDSRELEPAEVLATGGLRSDTGDFVVWVHSREATTVSGNCLGEDFPSDCNLNLVAGWNSAEAQIDGEGTIRLRSASIPATYSWQFEVYAP